jgi:hypothetical protein
MLNDLSFKDSLKEQLSQACPPTKFCRGMKKINKSRQDISLC